MRSPRVALRQTLDEPLLLDLVPPQLQRVLQRRAPLGRQRRRERRQRLVLLLFYQAELSGTRVARGAGGHALGLRLRTQRLLEAHLRQ